MDYHRVLWSRLFLTGCFLMDVFAQQGCDKVFSSYRSGPREGYFQSPGYPSHYPNNASCKFKFIGQKGSERVQIRFTDFNLQGRRPTCSNDYIHIYSQLKKESDELLTAAQTGPFCGEGLDGLPSLLLSTKHILVIHFHSNAKKSNNGFRGTYKFVQFDNDLPTASPDLCSYLISSSDKSRGNMKSPTYPGVYPDNIFCSYKLEGSRGQRIKLTFEDFSLFHGGEYCPFDYLTIYDGIRTTNPKIGKFCGSFNRSTVIYSTSETMRLEFTTGQDRLDFDDHPYQSNADFQFERRGFNISYEFSDTFVKLDHTYVASGATHIRGTECDLLIQSGGQSNGTFMSPAYPHPFPEGIVCRYVLDGLMDDQHLEKVKVQLFHLNIPGNLGHCLLGYLSQINDSHFTHQAAVKKICGTKGHTLLSNGPRMILTLNTTKAVQGGKFVAKYNFITDYGIPGNVIEEGKCKFHYLSSPATDVREGTFNSPRHPGVYPLNTDCEYIFEPQQNEMVVISFTVFVLSDSNDQSCDRGDYLAFYENVGPRKKGYNFTLTEKFCGVSFPGPYATSRYLKVVFHSDNKAGYVGFKARYKFAPRSYLDHNTEYSAFIDASGTGGVIHSPAYPSKYPSFVYCEWIITARERYNKILAEITDLRLEGQYAVDNKSSCETAAIRIYNDSMSLQPVDLLCGRKEDIDVAYHSFHDSIKITFVTSQSSLGSKGFKISWTEVHSWTPGMECTGFQCTKNKHCISADLKCNREPNCGRGDKSDETAECPNSSAVPILHISIGTSISSFFCIILLICGFYHRRKLRTERFPPDHDHVEVRYVSAPTGCNTTDRLLMEDRLEGNTMANENHNNTSTTATNTTQSPRCQKVSMV